MEAPVFLNSLVTKEDSVLEGSSSNPNKGTPDIDVLSYAVDGPFMDVFWQFKEGAGSDSGSGVYLLKVPGGYSVNHDYINLGSDPHANIVGKCAVIDSAGTPVDLFGYVVAYDGTHLAMVVNKEFVGSANLGLNSADAPVAYSLQARFPVLGRNYQW